MLLAISFLLVQLDEKIMPFRKVMLVDCYFGGSALHVKRGNKTGPTYRRGPITQIVDGS